MADSDLGELSDIEDQYESKRGSRWDKSEDDLLQIAVSEFGGRNWREIARRVPGRTSVQCLHRWEKILKPGLIKGPWTPEEDALLK